MHRKELTQLDGYGQGTCWQIPYAKKLDGYIRRLFSSLSLLHRNFVIHMDSCDGVWALIHLCVLGSVTKPPFSEGVSVATKSVAMLRCFDVQLPRINHPHPWASVHSLSDWTMRFRLHCQWFRSSYDARETFSLDSWALQPMTPMLLGRWSPCHTSGTYANLWWF